MPGSGVKHYTCIVCKKRTKPGQDRRWISNQPNHINYAKNVLHVEIKDDTVNCAKCFMRIQRKYAHNNDNDQHHQENETMDDTDPDFTIPANKKPKYQSPKSIPLQIFSTGKSHSSCCLCRKRGGKLVVVPTEARYRLFIEKEVLLLSGSRCCSRHLMDNYFNENEITNIDVKCPTDFNKSDLCELISYIRRLALRSEHSRIDFDNGDLNDSDYLSLTGITKDNFNDICSHIATLRSNKNRSSRTCVALLLVKLRTGMSNRLLSTLFNISKSSVKRAITSARKELSQHFTPHYIGFNHVTRQEIIQNHTRPLAQELFGNEIDAPAILILDGTYIYIQKSNNFLFQRRSYSMHKNRPLVKPMIIVSSTGYIVSILGPYLADTKNNDASILKHNIKTNMDSMNDWVRAGDVLIVDRGFRDATEMLDDLGIKSEMPNFLPKGQKQFTTEEANTSRMVTKVRWVVESVNGRLKQWKYLQNIVPNIQIPHIGETVKLIGAICNKYKPPLSSGDKESDQALAAKIKVLAKKKNELKERVEREGLNSRSCAWKEMDAEHVVNDFPRLSEEELRNLTVGVYQLKLAKCYTQEHLNDDSDFIIKINEDVVNILRVHMQSRHTSSKKYYLWIHYDEIEIKSWYCQCKSGSRVVGTCAHIAAVIWFLSFGRYTENTSGVKDWTEFVEDAAKIPVLVDDSESEDENPEE